MSKGKEETKAFQKTDVSCKNSHAHKQSVQMAQRTITAVCSLTKEEVTMKKIMVETGAAG